MFAMKHLWRAGLLATICSAPTLAPAVCLQNETVTLNGVPVTGNSFNLLGSPSGLAGPYGATGVTIAIDGTGNPVGEVWFQDPNGLSGITGPVNLFPNANLLLDCEGHEIADTVYLQIVGTVFPTFGGSGDLSLTVLCEPDYQILRTIHVHSTDIDGDGDTDEDDENALIAGINSGTNPPQFNLDFSGNVDAADRAILVTEARRRVVLPYSSSSWASEECNVNAIPKPQPPGGYAMYAPAAITDLSVTGELLSWTAPADDGSTGSTGPATRYDIRASTSTITEANFASCGALGWPTPGTPGATQTLSISNLSCGTWYFAMKTIDNVDNVSAISNVVSVTISDNVAPATISNLTGSPGGYMVKLNWTAPGDDGSTGLAAQYDVRYTVGTGAFNWNSATVGAVATPSSPGTTECLVVDQLTPNTNYKFAIKTKDNCPNWSAQSNVLSIKTKPASFTVSCASKASPEDAAPPATLSLDFDRVVSRDGHSMSLQYSLSPEVAGQPYDLSVYDVRGRRTRFLESGEGSVGQHVASWDLRGTSGSQVPAGLYIVRLRAGGLQTAKSMIVR